MRFFDHLTTNCPFFITENGVYLDGAKVYGLDGKTLTNINEHFYKDKNNVYEYSDPLTFEIDFDYGGYSTAYSHDKNGSYNFCHKTE